MYRIATLTAAFFLVTSAALAQEATFEALGFLPGGASNGSNAADVSADGSVVVGYGFSAEGQEAFRWEDGVMEGLGDFPEGPFFSVAYGVSADGSVVVGGGFSDEGPEAFRWEDGVMEGLGDLPGGLFSSVANGVSADGSVVVGRGNTEEGQEAVRWEDGVMEGLGDLPGGDFSSEAYRASADGSVVVGRGNLAEAFRWEDGAMESLGDLPGGDLYSIAYRVSADGSLVVGLGTSDEGAEAFVWTEEEGMRNLKEVLERDHGLDLSGWTLLSAGGVSADGTVIVGVGDNPDGDLEAWRVVIPRPVADEATPEALADVLSTPNPNPASGTSTFTIAVEHEQRVAVEVFDVTGRRVEVLYEGSLAAGMSETLTLDASALPAGVYMIRATGEDFTRTRRVTIVR